MTPTLIFCASVLYECFQTSAIIKHFHIHHNEISDTQEPRLIQEKNISEPPISLSGNDVIATASLPASPNLASEEINESAEQRRRASDGDGSSETDGDLPNNILALTSSRTPEETRESGGTEQTRLNSDRGRGSSHGRPTPHRSNASPQENGSNNNGRPMSDVTNRRTHRLSYANRVDFMRGNSQLGNIRG